MTASNGAGGHSNGASSNSPDRDLDEVVITYHGENVISGSKRAVLTTFWGVVGLTSAATAMIAFLGGMAAAYYDVLDRFSYRRAQPVAQYAIAAPMCEPKPVFLATVSVDELAGSLHAMQVSVRQDGNGYAFLTRFGRPEIDHYWQAATGSARSVEDVVSQLQTVMADQRLRSGRDVSGVLLQVDCLPVGDVQRLAAGLGVSRVAFYGDQNGSCQSL